MLTHFLLTTLGAKPNRYQTTHPQGVENRAHLVVGDLHPLLQESRWWTRALSKEPPAPSSHSSQMTSRTFLASSRAPSP